MGKKKSVVLMTLITIVMLVLCAVVAFPSVPVPGSNGIKKWNPAVLQYDLGSEFSGGHYAYYYPNGVISETEYNNNVAALEGEEKAEYEASYVRHGATGLYLSTDEDDGIFTVENKTDVSLGFREAFLEAAQLVEARFAARAQYTGSSYRVSVVDNYAIRVELSATENTKELDSKSYAVQAFSAFANMGKLTLEITDSEGSELVDELKEDGATIADLIEKVTVKTQYEIANLRLHLTKKGTAMIKAFKASEATSLDLKISDSDSALLQITKENINDKNEVELGVRYEEEKLYADTISVLLNSAIDNGGVYINGNETTPFTLRAPTDVEVRTFAPIYGDILVWVYVAILAVIVLASVLAIVKMGGFGVMNVYTSVSYLIITALCFAFVSGGVFAVSLASMLVFLAGLAIVNVLNAYIYGAIKAEAAQGKTIQSSVKSGYKKTLWTIVDVYAVLLLGALAFLIGVASLNTIACQAVICVFAGAFCNLLWGRFINLLLLSSSKDKYKYFHLVREDDDDEE